MLWSTCANNAYTAAACDLSCYWHDITALSARPLTFDWLCVKTCICIYIHAPLWGHVECRRPVISFAIFFFAVWWLFCCLMFVLLFGRIKLKSEAHTIQGGPKKIGTRCFVRLNFIKYWPIFKLISVTTHFNSASSISKADTLNIWCKTAGCNSYFR